MTDVACDTIITAFGRMCCCIDPATIADATSSSSSSHKGSITRSRMGNEDIAVDNKNKCSSGTITTPLLLQNMSSSTVATTITTSSNGGGDSSPTTSINLNYPIGYSTRGHDAIPLLELDSALYSNPNNIKLLPPISAMDAGKKCLVLDLDETLVHSSFRAVSGADFVLPIQVRVFLVITTKQES